MEKDKAEFYLKTMFWCKVLSDSVNLICWSALALAFEKWWIALFAILFHSNFVESKTTKEK